MPRQLRIEYPGALYHLMNHGDRRPRGETTVTLKWIAERLRMGSWSYVANNLCQSAPRTR